MNDRSVISMSRYFVSSFSGRTFSSCPYSDWCDGTLTSVFDVMDYAIRAVVGMEIPRIYSIPTAALLPTQTISLKSRFVDDGGICEVKMTFIHQTKYINTHRSKLEQNVIRLEYQCLQTLTRPTCMQGVPCTCAVRVRRSTDFSRSTVEWYRLGRRG